MRTVNLENLWEALRGPWDSEQALDEDLRNLLRIPDNDGAALSAARLTVTANRVVVRAPDGRIVKGERPKVLSSIEQLQAATAAAVAQERAMREREFAAIDERDRVISASGVAAEKQTMDAHINRRLRELGLIGSENDTSTVVGELGAV